MFPLMLLLRSVTNTIKMEKRRRWRRGEDGEEEKMEKRRRWRRGEDGEEKMEKRRWDFEAGEGEYIYIYSTYLHCFICSLADYARLRQQAEPVERAWSLETKPYSPCRDSLVAAPLGGFCSSVLPMPR